MTYNINRRDDQSINPPSFTALVARLPDSEVWQHYDCGRRGTFPRLLLKIFALRVTFLQSGACVLGLVGFLRHPTETAPTP